jgi:hypothetical protein
LLVSHWPSQESFSSGLLVQTLIALKDDRDLGPAEALRQTMLRHISDPSRLSQAHPHVWGQFMIVGDGAPTAAP